MEVHIRYVFFHYSKTFGSFRSRRARAFANAVYINQTPDSKKEEFRKYLEKSGVIDSLTKALVGLYEEGERPSNAVDYMKQFMGAPTGIDVEALKAENIQLKEENGELKQAIEELNAKLDALKADDE